MRLSEGIRSSEGLFFYIQKPPEKGENMNTKGFIAAGMLVPIVIYALVVGAVIHKKAYNKAHGIERVDTLENPLPPEVAY